MQVVFPLAICRAELEPDRATAAVERQPRPRFLSHAGPALYCLGAADVCMGSGGVEVGMMNLASPLRFPLMATASTSDDYLNRF